MSDFNTPVMPPPRPQTNETFKYVAVGLLAAIVALLVVIVFSRGSESDGPVAVTTTEAERADAAPDTTEKTNKYDAYYDHVMSNSGRAQTMTKADVIEFGDLVCQTLDNGYTISDVVRVLADASTTDSDAELSASVTYGAITYLCPEYSGALSAYLGN